MLSAYELISKKGDYFEVLFDFTLLEEIMIKKIGLLIADF
jgi:hypothetical protein